MAEYSKQLAAGFITHFYGAIDKRLEEKTKAELLAYDVREGYDGLFVICKDDKLLYAFDKNMTPSAETGNFYELTGRNFIITDDVFNYDATKRNNYTIYLQPDINTTTSYPAGLYRFDSVESRYKLLEGYEIREEDKIKLFNNIYSTNNVLDPTFDATTLISDIKTGADKGFYDRKYVAVENKHAVECFFVAATTDPAVAEHLEFIYNDKYYKRFATDLYGYTISNDYEIIDKMYDTSGTTHVLIPGVKEKMYYLTTFQRVVVSGVRYTRTPGLYGWNGTDYFKVNDAFDEKTIKTIPGFGNKAMPARTVIGGYRDILGTGGVEFDQTFTTDADGAIINQTVTPEKVRMNIIVDRMERNKPVIFSLINSTAGSVFLEGELSIYPTASASVANSTFEVKGDNFYFKVVYTEAGEGTYSMTLNVSKEAGLIANTTYTFSINYTTVDYHYVNNRFIEMDNTTITDVNPLDKTIGPLHAKSAVEVATFPTTGILPETIYRLTAEITISGKKYAPGLYVYDTTDAANPKWLSVGGSEVDEKTILSRDDTGNISPLHTAVGGWIEKVSAVPETDKTQTISKDASSDPAYFIDESSLHTIKVYTMTNWTGRYVINKSISSLCKLKEGSNFTLKIKTTDGNIVTIGTYYYDMKSVSEDVYIYKRDVPGFSYDNDVKFTVNNENSFSIEEDDMGYVCLVDAPLEPGKYNFRDFVFEFNDDVKNDVIHPIKSEFINIDNTTLVNDESLVGAETGMLHAKSAIVTDKLSTITTPMDEVIYRLTAEETIGTKKYAKGLYVYDSTLSTPSWISVGGSEVDEFTIVSTDTSGDPKPLRAKSAIAVNKLSTVTSPIAETIYRLTAEETISGTKYKRGLYIYDTTSLPNAWVSVSGEEVDEKTILSTNESEITVPLHTAVGGNYGTYNYKNTLLINRSKTAVDRTSGTPTVTCTLSTPFTDAKAFDNITKITGTSMGYWTESGGTASDGKSHSVTSWNITENSETTFKMTVKMYCSSSYTFQTDFIFYITINKNDLTTCTITSNLIARYTSIKIMIYADGYSSDITPIDTKFIPVDKTSIKIVDSKLTVPLDPYSGLKITEYGLGLNPYSTSGITLTQTGFGVYTAIEGGLSTDENGLKVDLVSTGGLQKNTNGISIKCISNGGIQTTEDGTSIKCIENGGIQTTDDGASIKLNSSYSGLKLDNDGLSLNIKYTSGTTLPETGTEGEIFFLYT